MLPAFGSTMEKQSVLERLYALSCLAVRPGLTGQNLARQREVRLAVLSSRHADIVGEIAIEIKYPELTNAQSTLQRPLFEQIHTSLSG